MDVHKLGKNWDLIGNYLDIKSSLFVLMGHHFGNCFKSTIYNIKQKIYVYVCLSQELLPNDEQ